jgi:heme/copper-type cytochrome/quinol oxidase subunit 2
MGLASGVISALGRVVADQTNLQQTNDLVWVMVGISVSGAIITFAFLVYSVWKWRDNATNRRRYG